MVCTAVSTTKHPRKQSGFSLIEGLISIFILGLLMASHMQLMSYTLTGPGQSANDELLNQLSRIGEIVATRINRGGGYLDNAGRDKGIQVCSLDTGGNQCTRYSDRASNFCISLPTQIGNGALATLDVKGFRLLNGKLQQREIDNVNMGSFDFQNFCTSGVWENLNDPQEFSISTLKFCRFDSSNLNTIKQNYLNQCPDILSNNAAKNMFWIAIFEASTSKVGGSRIEQTRIIQLLNETKVTSP